MWGEPINAVKQGIYALKDKVAYANKINKHVEVKINLIGFATKAFWIGDIRHFNGFVANGCTNLAAAYQILDNKLHDFFERDTTPLYPIIVLLSDGQPTETFWMKRINALYKYKPFRKATRLAIAYGVSDDYTLNILNRFTGSNNIVQTFNLKSLINSIHDSVGTAVDNRTNVTIYKSTTNHKLKAQK